MDLIFADPAKGHPVAIFGKLANALERKIYRNSVVAGLLFNLVLVGSAIFLGWMISILFRDSYLGIIPIAIVTWTVLGGTSLIKAANAMKRLLLENNLVAARLQLRSLCGRDATSLNVEELCRATVESVAENTPDSVVGPLFWGAIFGIPGLLAYRAINTLDAMVGHRSLRYSKFGMISARLDDLANLIPARFSALLTVLFAWVANGSGRRALAIWVADGSKHASPNAGQIEAAFAGALGLSLGGLNVYEGVAEDFPKIGNGRNAEISDIQRATRLSFVLQVCSAISMSIASAMLHNIWR
jgi:adenosylcobinamide-phosphate synthase